MKLNFGLLTIKGENLRINKLNIDSSDVSIDGEIDSLAYSNVESISKKGGSILGKIFK